LEPVAVAIISLSGISKVEWPTEDIGGIEGKIKWLKA